jgi:hypothetical protein
MTEGAVHLMHAENAQQYLTDIHVQRLQYQLNSLRAPCHGPLPSTPVERALDTKNLGMWE